MLAAAVRRSFLSCGRLRPIPMDDNSGRVRLTSWKEIAAHLGREVRTVIRWEKERGLPLHRLPGGRGGSVFAFTDELDQWAAGQSEQDPSAAAKTKSELPKRAIFGVAAVAVAALAAAAGLSGARANPQLADVRVGIRSIEGLDEQGRPLWSHSLPGYAEPIHRRVAQLVDLNGDSHPEAIAAVALMAQPSIGAPLGTLYALGKGGNPLWQRSIDTRLSFGSADFEGPWQPDDVLAFTNGDEPFIAWAVHHHTWWPSLLAVFDARGSRIGMFANSGWIRTMSASADGRHIIWGGFSNSRKAAAFAVLDARNPNGASPEDPGSAYACSNCPEGRPLRYFLVDWSDIATALPPDEREVKVVVYPPTGRVELRAQQRSTVEFIVELSSTFEVVKRSVSDSFWEWHRRLELDGTLAHGRAHCPYRDGPLVREWTPVAGWITGPVATASLRPPSPK